MDAGRIRATGLALFAAVGATLAFVAPASAATSKPYSLVICAPGQDCTSNPAVVSPGAGTTINPTPDTMTATFTNLNKPGSGITLGSDNLNVPSSLPGFSVTGVTTIVIGNNTYTQACPTRLSQQGPPCYTLPTGGTTVELRNLNLPADAPNPDATATITMTVDTPAPSTAFCTSASPCLWTDVAKQSNDFSGTGNDLGNPETGVRGTVLSAETTCQKGGNSCVTMLADNSGNSAGSVNVTVTTLTGKTALTQLQALDFGVQPDPTACNGQFGAVSATHFTYWDIFNGADASQTVSITTTTSGLETPFQQEFCLLSERQFTMKTWNGLQYVLAPATAVTYPPNTSTIVFEGLLPDCSTNPNAVAPTVDCKKLPGVLQRVPNNGTTATTVASIAPGFDYARGYN
jgi:hypothetical protein